MTTILERGLVTGPHELLNILPKGAFKVVSWQNGRSPKAQAETFAALAKAGAYAESIFDARHGRRHMLFVYGSKEQRKKCWDFHTGSAG